MDIAEKIVQKALDINSTKSDIIKLLKDIVDNNKELEKITGSISEEDIQEIKFLEDSVAKLDNDTDAKYNKKGDTIEVHKVQKSKKIVELYVKEASKEEARYFADLYYQFQSYRIAIENQIRSIDQGMDQDDKGHKDAKQRKSKNLIDTPATMSFRHHLLDQIKTIENDIKACLSDYSDRMPLGRYCKSIVGIGPVFATLICSELYIPDLEELDPDKQIFTAGNWISYIGLNDNNRPWIKSDTKARELVEEAIEENAGVIDDDAVRLLCAKTKWDYNHYYKFCCDRKTGEFKGFSKDALIKGTKLIPYNKNLKKTMYLIGQSFIKVQNKENSLYGKLYKMRLQYEINRNATGYNKEAAEKALLEKNWNKSTVSYKAYIKGELPKSQLSMRAQRWTEKIFISHIFEFSYLEKYKKPAPVPYIFTVDGTHKDYIGPEVPYDQYLSSVEAIAASKLPLNI